ncbi:MAG: ROK family protein, partial [Ilumatobacteraceae bacterium]
NGDSTLRATATVAEIFGAAAHGDAAAQAVVAAEADLVARAVLSVVSVVDPEKVILAGGIGANPNLLRPVIERLELLAPFLVKVESSKLGERSGIVGALALARDIARNRLFGEVTTADD